MGIFGDPCCPVLRRRRPRVTLKLVGQQEKLAVSPGWLSALNHEDYKRGVKQAMLIAGTDICFHGFRRRYGALPDEMKAQFRRRLRCLITGEGDFPVPPGDVRVISRLPEERQLLVKQGSRLRGKQIRSCLIQGDHLTVHKSSALAAPVEKVYQFTIIEGVVFEQLSSDTNHEPPFEEQFMSRIRIETPKSLPMFIYTNDVAAARRWVQQIRYSRWPPATEQLAALRSCVHMIKVCFRRRGWAALLRIYQSVVTSRELMEQFQALVGLKELQRGWRPLRSSFATRKRALLSSRQAKLDQERRKREAAEIEEQTRRQEADKVRQKEEEERRRREEAELLFKEKTRRAAILLRDGLAAAADRLPPWVQCPREKEFREALVTEVQRKFRQNLTQSKAATTSACRRCPSARSRLQVRQGLVTDGSLSMLSSTEALQLCLSPNAFRLWKTSAEARRLEQVASAEAGLPPGPMCTQLSECGSLLLVSEPGQVEGQRFVPLKQISSVVLHASPTHGRASCQGSTCLTLHGPRVAWARRLAADGKGVVGADHALHFLQSLVKGASLQRLVAKLSLKVGHIPATAADGQQRSRVLAHLLGRRFSSQPRSGEDVDYDTQFQASVPLPAGSAALEALEGQVLRVDIERLPDDGDRDGRVVWTASVPLRRLLAATVAPQADASSVLSELLRGGGASCSWRFRLSPAGAGSPVTRGAQGAFLAAQMQVQVHTPVVPGPETLAPESISPELLSRGPTTTLFSGQRGAWFDPELGPEQLLSGRVADFVELSLGALRFGEEAPPSGSSLCSYHVVVDSGGSCASSPGLYRPPPEWSRALRIEADTVHFAGTRLLLPLSPGFWSSADGQSNIQLSVFRQERVEVVALDYQGLLQAAGSGPPPQEPVEKVYHIVLCLGGLLLDRPAQDVSLQLGSAAAGAPHCEVGEAGSSRRSAEEEASLSVTIVLRDRDYAWAQSASGDEALLPLFVGDRVILSLEEVLLAEAVCRRPRWPHEVSASGLVYDQRTACRRIRDTGFPCRDAPGAHQFVLPQGQLEFQRSHLPGVYWRILDSLSEGGSDASSGPSVAPLVDRLTHNIEPVACTLLALYTNGTCDVECSQLFLDEWRSKPQRKYCILSSVVIVETASPEQPRVLLKGVPLSHISAMQAAGFNVYDAAVASVEDAVQRDVQLAGVEGPGLAARSSLGECMRVRAGPVPSDANPAICQYEWSLHLCAETEAEMHRLVRLLRRSVQRDHSRQTNGSGGPALADPAPSCQEGAPDPGLNQPQGQSRGQLEVLLIEARRLRLARAATSDSLDTLLAATVPVATRLGGLGLFSGSRLNVCVKLRFLAAGESKGRSSVPLTSPSIAGTDSPDWSQMEGLRECGGWVFRSPHLSVEGTSSGLILALEVWHRDLTGEHLLGTVRLPGGNDGAGEGDGDGDRDRGKDLLCGKKPFHDLWLPLATSAQQRTSSESTDAGDLHIMTLWLPAGCEGRKLDHSFALSHFQSQVASLLSSSASLGCCKPGFSSGHNPNSAIGGPACSRAELLGRRTAALLGSGPLQECCEQRRLRAWKTFQEGLAAEGLSEIPLGELRTRWLEAGETVRVEQLNKLLAGGVASSWRFSVWPAITHSGQLLSQHSGQALLEEYLRFVRVGRSRQWPALRQLGVDLAAATLECKDSEDGRLHLLRAGNVCTALLASACSGQAVIPEDREADVPTNSSQAVYSKALLEIAAKMLLPGCMETNGCHSHQFSEAQVFWLLHRLVLDGNGSAFHHYYVKRTAAMDTSPLPASAAGCSGDVFLLDCAMVVHEQELWVRFGVQGFQLESIFFGAFLNWFAQLLPPAALFRLWDILVGETSNPAAAPHSRHTLVDFAFGVLRANREDLLRCQSALEVYDSLQGFFSSMDDPEAVTDTTMSAGTALWSGIERNQVLQLWNDGIQAYGRFYAQFQEQEIVLQSLADALDPKGHASLSLSNVTEHLGPHLRRVFADANHGCRLGGLFRGVPPELQERAPLVEQGNLSTLLRLLASSGIPGAAGMMTAAGVQLAVMEACTTLVGEPPPPPKLLPSPLGSAPEPAPLTEEDWENKLTRTLPSVSPHLARALFAAFSSSEDSHLSLTELLIGLICHAVGTVREKAAALFDIYSFWDARLQGQHGLHHSQPLSRLAMVPESIAADGDPRDRFAAASLPPPVSRTASLLLRIWTDWPQQNTPVGEVVINNLRPFVNCSSQEVDPIWFSIWSRRENEHSSINQALSTTKKNMSSLSASSRSYNLLGKMYLALAWRPRSPESTHIGQLHLKLYSVQLLARKVAARPLLCTVTLDDLAVGERLLPAENHDEQNRPASVTQHVSFRARPVLLPGHMHQEDPEPMREWVPSGDADQRSTDNVMLPATCIDKIDQTPNAISLQAVRLLMEGVLRRGYHLVTNRQAALLADITFGRARAVPGILEALIVPGEDLAEFESVSAVKENYTKMRKAFADITQPLLLELERRAALGTGELNLRPLMGVAGTSLKSLRIADPFPGQPKVLWLRLVADGSGERSSVALQLTEAGQVCQPSQVPLDTSGFDTGHVGHDTPWQSVITKEEFLSCAMASPLMSEALRSNADAGHKSCAGDGDRDPGQVPLALDIAIAAPGPVHPESQGVLLELWGSRRSDTETLTESEAETETETFLGEAWLPPREELSGERHDLKLPLHRKTLSDLAAAWAAQSSVENKAALSLPEPEACGAIFLSAQWFPAQNPVSSRLPSRSRASHLALNLIQAGIEMPSAVAKLREGCRCAYLKGYLLDCTTTQPKVSRGPGVLLFTSSTRSVHQTGAPPDSRGSLVTWEYEEIRVPVPLENAKKQVAMELPLLFGGSALGEATDQPQGGTFGCLLEACCARHSVKVFLDDTIEEFKNKSLVACQEVPRTAGSLIHSSRLLSMLGHYEGVRIGRDHVVLCFNPPHEKDDWAAQVQYGDPQNWRPLDPGLTFGHYAECFGFGRSDLSSSPPLLRISRMTEAMQSQNPHCRHLCQAQDMYFSKLEDLNNTHCCFAHARYKHSADGWSAEWRPCIVHGHPEMNGPSRRIHQVSWPLCPNAAGRLWSVDEVSVLFGHAQPAVQGAPAPGHSQALTHIPDLHKKGKSDQDIADMLNVHLMKTSQRDSGDLCPPPPITASLVRSYLQRSWAGKLP